MTGIKYSMIQGSLVLLHKKKTDVASISFIFAHSGQHETFRSINFFLIALLTVSSSVTAPAEFTDASRSCDQYLMVGWSGEGNAEVLDNAISIDIWEASNDYLDDNQIYFD